MQGEPSVFKDCLTGNVYEVTDATCAVTEDVEGVNAYCTSLFFVGCSLLNHAPDLALDVYQLLQEKGVADGISIACCGKVLRYGENGKEAQASYGSFMAESLIVHGVQRIITACPNCADTLGRFIPEDSGIQILPLPKVLADLGLAIETLPDFAKGMLTVHDSCPDRKDGTFAEGTRQLLAPVGFVEMEHNRAHSRCCGSLARAAGKEDLCVQQAHAKGEEASAAGADGIVTACMSCASLLSHQLDRGQMPVYHYLELLFGKRIDWSVHPDWLSLQFFITAPVEAGRSYILNRG